MNKPSNMTEHGDLKPAVLFVCLHGSAKSLIAAEHLKRLAKGQRIAVHGESAGVEPDAEVPPAVLAGLAVDGIDVRGYEPRLLTADKLAAATHIVVCGCELRAGHSALATIERWDDLPFVSDGYEAARAAIVQRLEDLLHRLDTT